MKKALVFIDYDMLIRHFILNGTFDELRTQFEVKYIFHRDSTSEKKGIYTDIEDLGLENYDYFDVPRIRMGSWDTLYRVTNLYRQRHTGHHKMLMDLYRYLLDEKIIRKLQILSIPGIYHYYRWRTMRRMGYYKPLEDFLRKEFPDIILHPSILTGYFINELVQIAPRLGIPFVVLMNSWDNPATKAATTGFPDKLVVWGDQSRRQALEYMQIPPDRVEIFGPAQFQLYRKPIKKSHEELCHEFEVPVDCPIILYAGTSKGNNETDDLLAIEEAIVSGALPMLHVLYRPHPWRQVLSLGERSFYDLDLKHVTMDPHMREYYDGVITGGRQGFSMAQYDVTHRLLHLVSAILSPLTTLQIEGLYFGNPGMIVFTESDENRWAKDFQEMSKKVAHFADLLGFEGLLKSNGRKEMIDHIPVLLERAKDREFREECKAFARTMIMLDGPTYGERLLTLAEKLIGRDKSYEQ